MLPINATLLDQNLFGRPIIAMNFRFKSIVIYTGTLLASNAALANPWFYDSFLQDDYSMDPEAQGFTVAPPPPTVEGEISQQLDIRNERLPGVSFSRLRMAVVQPASEMIALSLDTELDMRWPLSETQWNDALFDTRITTQRLTLDIDSTFANVSAGRQSITWGSIPGAGVLDVASPYSLDISEDISRTRVPATSVFAHAQWHDFDVSAFFTPDPPTAKPYPIPFGEPGNHSGPDDIQLPPGGGFSVHSRGPRSAIGFYSAVLPPENPTVTDQAINEDTYWLLGSSLSYELGNIEADIEVAFKSGLRPASQATVTEPLPEAITSARDRLDAGVSLNFDATPLGDWSAYLTLRHWVTQQDLQDVANTQSEMAIAWQNRFLDERLTTYLTAYSALLEPELIAVGKAEYQLNDHWTTSLRVTRFAAAEDTAFADQDGNTDWLAVVKYAF